MQSFAPKHPVMQACMFWHAGEDAAREGHTLLLCRHGFRSRGRGEARLWISASQRFILFFDGEWLGRGPSRSDPDRWGVRTYDLEWGPGAHVVAVVVTHRGSAAGKAQLGGPAFLLVAADGGLLAEAIRRPSAWRSWHHAGWKPVAERAGEQRGHMAVGAGEHFEGTGFPWGWKTPEFDDSGWTPMQAVSAPLANEWGNRIGGHHLRLDPLPEMEEVPIQFAETGELQFPVQIGPRSELEQVFDIGCITNAYLSLEVGGGAGSTIEFVTCESPVDPVTGEKGNRDVWKGKSLPGMIDRVRPGGQNAEIFETHWFRSFRYLHLRVKTGDFPLVLRGLGLRETRFPLRRRATFYAPDNKDWASLLRRTHRTALLCAHETTFDCPHYEQGQFGGDSRIQALYHYAVCGEDRLIRKAIDDLAASRVWSGILRSHYPADFHQIIPTFSLHWIGMLNDFRVWRGEASFLRRYLFVARGILAWFDDYRRQDGLLGYIPYAPFIDWAFPFGNAPQDGDGGSSIVSMLFAQACTWLAKLERFCGYAELASRWDALHDDLCAAVRGLCLDQTSGLVADTPACTSFSVHAQAETVLTGALEGQQAASALRIALASPRVRQPASFYYRHHIGMALLQCGAGGDVHKLLRPWFKILKGTGLTTLPEKVEHPRSDCHAWSVFSGIAPFTHILGLRPDDASHGMARMIWDPHLGDMPGASGHLPTPHGRLAVSLRRENNRLRGRIHSPVEFVLPHARALLPPGEHDVDFPLAT